MNKASKKYYKAVKLLIPAKGTNEKKIIDTINIFTFMSFIYYKRNIV